MKDRLGNELQIGDTVIVSHDNKLRIVKVYDIFESTGSAAVVPLYSTRFRKNIIKVNER